MARSLAKAAEAAAGQPKAFPFWLRKYKWTQDILDCVSDIPKETLDGYPEELQRILDRHNEHPWETRRLNNKPHFLQHRLHEVDTNSPAPQSVGLLGYLKVFENEIGKTGDAVIKRWHRQKSGRLSYNLRTLKMTNFPQYWRLVQDFNLWHHTRLSHEGFLHLGWWMNPGPESGQKVVDFEDYVDPETLYGCEETGESRFAVCKRNGKVWKPGMQVYIKDNDRIWKLAEIDEVNAEERACAVTLLATGESIPLQNWEDIMPFDLYATSRMMANDDPVRQEEEESSERHTYFDNLKQSDPARFEQEWYGHISNKFYDGQAPTGSFRGWRQRFMHWDPMTTSHKRVRWVMGLSKYMQRRMYLGYRAKPELFSMGSGKRGRKEPWWVQHPYPLGH
eukprot:TRINITY_DN13510_c0_g3_i1.p1 TRINITY_DN13510_c0_g3~~TRINITY_DN13510_c0_g3_i1.p1  ORF type:complete len:392 (+),score=115.78 TRINITY_DN13510_c0_g3_i1:116-1291(+)